MRALTIPCCSQVDCIVGTHLVGTIGWHVRSLSIVRSLDEVPEECHTMFVPGQASSSNNFPRRMHARDAQHVRERDEPQETIIDQLNHHGLGQYRVGLNQNDRATPLFLCPNVTLNLSHMFTGCQSCWNGSCGTSLFAARASLATCPTCCLRCSAWPLVRTSSHRERLWRGSCRMRFSFSSSTCSSTRRHASRYYPSTN